MALLAQLGLPPPARLRAPIAPALAPSAPLAGPPGGGAPQGAPAGARGKPARRTEGEVEMGGEGFSVEHVLGPAVTGPRITELLALMSADGSVMNRSNSALGGQINRQGTELHASFASLSVIERRWRERYGAVQALATRSAADIKKMEQARGAVGGRSSKRQGAYVRQQSEAYVKADRAVKDAMRAIGTGEEGLRKSVSAVHTVALKQDKLAQERLVQKTQAQVDAERASIAARKSALGTIFDVGLKVLKQDWGSLAEDAAKYVIGEVFDSLPTERLDQLAKQLETATTKLRQLEDAVLMSEYETESSGLREAALRLEDARADLVDRLADLRLARRTAMEALGESGSTGPAAKMIEQRGKMLELMGLTRQAITQYQAESKPVTEAITKLANLCKAYPDRVRKTEGVDPEGEHARSLYATAGRNHEALSGWRLYIDQELNSCHTALEILDRKGPGSFVEHFDRVAGLLQDALEGR